MSSSSDIIRVIKERDTFLWFMLEFYENISPDDGFHDIIYKVEGVEFPAHRFIVASNCKRLGLLPVCEKTRIVEIEGIHPVIFGQLLKFLYCGWCDLVNGYETTTPRRMQLPSLIRNLAEIEKLAPTLTFSTPRYKLADGTVKKFSDEVISDFDGIKVTPLLLFRKVAYDLDIHNLKMVLSHMCRPMWRSDNTPQCILKDPIFNSMCYPNLLDFKLVANTGQKIRIHRCMLIAHEYFRTALKSCWNEKGERELQMGMDIKTLRHFIDFLYTGTTFCEGCSIIDDANFWLKMLILSDYYVVRRLKKLCEDNLSSHVFFNNVNAEDTLNIAVEYNAKTLETSCIQKIHNLPTEYNATTPKTSCLQKIHNLPRAGRGRGVRMTQ